MWESALGCAMLLKSTFQFIRKIHALQPFNYFHSSISSPGRPNIRRLRSMEPTATYFASAPNLALVTFPGHRRQLFHMLKSWLRSALVGARIVKITKTKDVHHWPVPDKSGKVLIRFHSSLTLATWQTLQNSSLKNKPNYWQRWQMAPKVGCSIDHSTYHLNKRTSWNY